MGEAFRPSGEEVRSDLEIAGVDFHSTAEAVAAFIHHDPDDEHIVTGLGFVLRMAGHTFTIDVYRGNPTGEDVAPLAPLVERGPMETDERTAVPDVPIHQTQIHDAQIAAQRFAPAVIHLLDEIGAAQTVQSP